MEDKSATSTVTLSLPGEGEVFEDFQVEKTVAMESEVIKKFMQDAGDQVLIFTVSWIPCKTLESRFPYIKRGKILEKVIDYCEYHANAKSNSISEENVKIWDMDFAKNVVAADENQAIAYHIIRAADFLDIKGLFDLLCKAVGNVLKTKVLKRCVVFSGKRMILARRKRQQSGKRSAGH
ncbi:SKP1-like protein 1 [Cryptomeria japonica]|uniref:SKP1-like protein 1 n=1 Tax=Cryptomeria japonica TaxID=3369 RepID=UPI0027D9D9F2|nr:SKP1-like protein 1 [Cryptomeria japonica]